MQLLKERIFLSLVIVIISIGCLLNFIPQSTSDDEEHAFVMKAHTKEKFDIIFFGDSRVYRGLSPQVFNTVIGNVNVLNFGFSSAGYSEDMLLDIESKLNPNGAKIILLGITAHSLTPKGADNAQYKSLKLLKREDLIQSIFLYKFLKLFSPTSYSLINEKVRPIKNYSNQEIFYENGYVATFHTPVDSMAAIKSYISDFKDNLVDTNIISLLSYKIKIWQRQGIKVFAYQPPTPLVMQETEIKYGNYNQRIVREKIINAGGDLA
jgi:hypothetical protein